MVCAEDYETRHPLDMVRPVTEDTSVPWSRSDRTAGSGATAAQVAAAETFVDVTYSTGSIGSVTIPSEIDPDTAGVILQYYQDQHGGYAPPTPGTVLVNYSDSYSAPSSPSVGTGTGWLDGTTFTFSSYEASITHTVDSQYEPDDPNNYYGWTGNVGSVSPTTLNGVTINGIFSQNPEEVPESRYFYIYLANSAVSQDFFTSITSSYGTLLSADAAIFGHSGTQTWWAWNVAYWSTATGSILVTIA